MSRLTPNCFFIESVAQKVGIPAALIFSRIDWSVDFHRRENQAQFFIKKEWWMYETAEGFQCAFPFLSIATIKRAISALKTANLIFHLRVRAKDRDQTNFYSVNYAEFEKLSYQNDTVALAIVYKFDIIKKLSYQFDTLGHVGDKAIVSKRSDAEDQNDPMQRIKMIPSSLSMSLTMSPSKKGGGEDGEIAPKREEIPPLLKIEEKEIGNGDGKEKPLEDDKNPPPMEQIETCLLWFLRTQKCFKSKIYTLEQITADLISIHEQTRTSWQDLLLMVKLLDSSSKSIAKKFARPCEWKDDPFDDGKTYLDKAMELLNGEEGKALKKKISEQERELNKEYRKPRLIQTEYTPEELEQRRLARLAERASWA